MKKGFGWEKTNSSKKDAAKYQVRVTDTLAKDQEGSQEWKLKSEGWKLATCRIVIRWLKEITIEVLKPNQLKDKKSKEEELIAERDARKATQVAQMPRNQVQRAQAQKVVQNGLQQVKIKIQNWRPKNPKKRRRRRKFG